MFGPRSGNQATTAVRTIRRWPTQMARHQRSFLHRSLEEETHGIADEDFGLDQNLVADFDGGVTASPRAEKRQQPRIASAAPAHHYTGRIRRNSPTGDSEHNGIDERRS
ncbi:hypothetical protein ACFXPA_11800 [Amycolatopsis sp. NPDC059090]|uniref:hypothetical protein n=1 Tax=unclassified Amycolatopsis TaxID=2618356 RepID=UPI0036719B0D